MGFILREVPPKYRFSLWKLSSSSVVMNVVRVPASQVKQFSLSRNVDLLFRIWWLFDILNLKELALKPSILRLLQLLYLLMKLSWEHCYKDLPWNFKNLHCTLCDYWVGQTRDIQTYLFAYPNKRGETPKTEIQGWLIKDKVQHVLIRVRI